MQSLIDSFYFIDSKKRTVHKTADKYTNKEKNM